MPADAYMDTYLDANVNIGISACVRSYMRVYIYTYTLCNENQRLKFSKSQTESDVSVQRAS
jgi:hypothetical protein